MFILLHPLVDACSAAVLLVGGNTWERWLAYVLLAFASELPLGIVLDRRTVWLRGAFLLGCGLTALGALGTVAGLRGEAPLLMAASGNALFHLTAGKRVLDEHPQRSGPIGLFISTGALGLTVGTMLGRNGCLWPMAIIAMVLMVGAICCSRRFKAVSEGDVADDLPRTGSRVIGAVLLLAGLFAVIAWRNHAGMAAGRLAAEAGSAMVIFATVAVWAGKAAGGYCADWLSTRFGGSRWLVTGLGVGGGLVLYFAGSPADPVSWLALALVANLATGPVLSLVCGTLGRRTGAAFGFNSFALFAGSFI